MKKIVLTSAAALFLTGTASAQQPSQAPSADITRAAAIADAERQFRALDTNGDGTLDAAEAKEPSEQRRAEGRQRMEERIAQMSAEERARFEQRRAQRGGGEEVARQGARERGSGPGLRTDSMPATLAEFRAQAEQRFDRLDLDRDGVITAAEQAQLRAQHGSRSE